MIRLTRPNRSEGRRRRLGLRRSRSTPNRTLGRRFEQLEDRRLLAVGIIGTNVLDSAEAAINTAGDISAVTLTVAGDEGQSVVAVRAHAVGTLDPTAPRIQDAAGTEITPVMTIADGTDGHEGLLLAELPAGEYRVVVGGEHATIGQFVLEVFLPGDINADGQVDAKEFGAALAAADSDMAFGNSWITARAFASAGIDLSGDTYHAEQDANFNGTIDRFDLAQVDQNHAAGNLQVTLVADDVAPLIDARLRNDTGRSDLPETFTDAITGDVTGEVIVGGITDTSSIASLRGSVDDADPQSFSAVTLAADGISVALTLADLEQLADGAALENNGSHTLFLIAEDQHGNVTAPPLEFVFAFDTIAPAAPTDLDLIASSDSGDLADDDLTNDNTPTITVAAEADTLVELLADGTAVGQVVVTGTPTSITVDALADGTRTMTATATDLAGNQSEASAELDITIDTTDPVIDTFDLAAGSDSGTPGDRITNVTVVDLVGETEPGVDVTLTPAGETNPSDVQGDFGFQDLTLAFGAIDLTVTVTDAAGNTTTRTETFVRDNDPKVVQPVDPVTEDEDADDKVVNLSGLFDDADLGDGDVLTLDVSANTNPGLVTATFGDTTTGDSIDNDTMTLAVAANANGVAELTIRATDSFGRTATSTLQVTVNPVNDLPDAVGTLVTTSENVPTEIDLRGLVTDVETADDDLVFAVFNGQFGTVELLADGFTARFTPTLDFHDDTANFRYTVTDTGDGTAAPKTTDEITVDVNVITVNDLPNAQPSAVTTNEDEAVDIDLWTLVDDTETPDDQLSFAVGGAFGGTVQLLADGHTAQFTPDANFNDDLGTAGFTYDVTDTGDAGEAPATVAGVPVDVAITSVNDPPNAVDDQYTVAPTHTFANLDVLQNDTDPDQPEGDTLTVVDFDAITVEGALVTLADNGTFSYDPNGVFDVIEPGTQPTDSFTYTISDAAGSFAFATVHLNIFTTAPPDATDDEAATDEETAIEIDVLADNGNGPDTDPDGNDALLTVIHIDAVSALGASLELTVDGTVMYDPTGVAPLSALAAGETATDTFTYTVQDEDGGTAQATVTVTVHGRNDPPTAVADTTGTDNATAIPVDVLENDSDPDSSDTLTVDSVDATSVRGAAVTLQGDGTVTYDPTGVPAFEDLTPGEEATDTFQYTIRDAQGELASATVTVTVTGHNDAPGALDDNASTDEDTQKTIAVLANDDDPNPGDTLSIDNADATSVQGAVITVEEDGTISYDPTSAAALQALPEGGSLSDTFQYTIRDSVGGLSAATVTVTVAGRNDAPTAEVDADSTDADQAIDIDVLANDEDPDTGDQLVVETFDAVSDRGATISLNADGTLHYDPTTSTALGALGAGGILADSFNYAVTDGHGGTAASASVAILVKGVNDDPTAVDDDGLTVTLNSLNNVLDVLANDTFTPDVGETLTIVDVGTPSANGQVVITDQGALLNYTPAIGFEGTETFTYTIEDDHGGSDQATASVTVQAAEEGDLVLITLLTSDLLGNPLEVQGNLLPTVTLGESFLLNVYVQDNRAVPEGVFAGYLDLEYDPEAVTYVGPDETGLVAGVDYGNSRFGDTTTPGLIDELGGADGFGFAPGTEGATRLLASVRMAATTATTTTFTASPADITPSHFVLLFGGGTTGVPTDQIDYGTTSLAILPAAAPAVAFEGEGLATGGAPIVALAAPSDPIPSVDDPLADPAAVVATPNGSDTAAPIAILAPAEPSGQLAGAAVEAAAADPIDLGLDAVLTDIAAEVTQAWADV